MAGNPHDSFFKAVFAQPETAVAHFAEYLPAPLLAQMDLSGATLCPGSYVDEELSQRHSDILYRVRLAGRDAFVYVLFEHQSTADPLMAFRLLRYMVRIWDGVIRDDPSARTLPPIVPIVLYHGRDCWTAATRFSDLLAIDPAVWCGSEPPGLDFGYVLTDLSRLDDDGLRGVALGRLALFLLRSSCSAMSDVRTSSRPVYRAPWRRCERSRHRPG